MTLIRPLTASEKYARFVLSAWNRREFGELETAVKQSPLKPANNLPVAEYERLDLIQDLGRHLLVRHSAGPVSNGTDRDAALSLVRHLARCE